MRPAIRSILKQALEADRPEAFEIDLARDIQYLYEHNTQQFVWCLYRNGTQLLPAATDIPSPFEGNPAFDGLEFARAFLATYGDEWASSTTTPNGTADSVKAKWFVFNQGRFTQEPANVAIWQLAQWQTAGRQLTAEYREYVARQERAGEAVMSRRYWESVIRQEVPS